MTTKLLKYLERNRINQADFARTLQTSRQNLSIWCAGRAAPRARVIEQIEHLTMGEVTAHDLLGIRPYK